MQLKSFLGVYLLALTVCPKAFSQTEAPAVSLTNGLISAEILLPDGEKGYYRGARFDWAGVIRSLEYKGHSYFGQWFDRYDPQLHDAIMGPVDEFREPIGFEEAKAGGEFIKIGVGKLKKPDDGKYSFGKKYEVTDTGVWDMVQQKDHIVFSQELKPVNGYGYRYEKTVRLKPNEATLVLEHRLVNTGTRRIETSTYNHNFFMIDDEPTGPGITTSFGFDVSAQGRGFGDLATAAGRTVEFKRPLQKGENVYSEDLRVARNQPTPYVFTIENLKTGAGVNVSGDTPIDAMVYWACATTACPEPYIALALEPGEARSWEISYTFYVKN